MTLTVELSNAVILAGYFAMGVLMSTWVLPVRWWLVTVMASIVFFATCALTHLHMLGHQAAGEPITLTDMSSWHMVLIHVPQAAAIWVAVIGLIVAQRWISRLLSRLAELETLLGQGADDVIFGGGGP